MGLSVEPARSGIVRHVLTGALMMAILSWAPLFGQSPARPAGPATVLIVYDEPGKLKDRAYLHALNLDNLLGHFQLKGHLVAMDSYMPGQLARYQAAFFIGAGLHAHVPPALLNDIRVSRRPFAWLGGHVGQLLATE
ncbi:MAG: hypothetical protein NTV49_08295, partial [Kiritimatiellaeota bacterium]|nr:hypothetical protein [Kiritimatiellota bacterium]